MIRYTNSLESVRVEDLDGGFFAGWPNPPTPETHLRLLHGSDFVVLALDDATGRVVGYVTAISDGVLTAYIPQLEVLEAYRGRGIGAALVRQMLDQLDHLYAIDVICDAAVQPFYARLGLQPYVSMIRRNYQHQSGI